MVSVSSLETWGVSRATGWGAEPRTATEEVLRCSQLSCQGGAHGALLLQGKGRGALVLLGGSDDRKNGGDSRNQRGGSGRRSRRVSDDVGPRGSGESGVVGGETRRGTSGALLLCSEGSRGGAGEGPKASDVGGPAHGEVAAC
jgi:hypothetical protein